MREGCGLSRNLSPLEPKEALANSITDPDPASQGGGTGRIKKVSGISVRNDYSRHLIDACRLLKTALLECWHKNTKKMVILINYPAMPSRAARTKRKFMAEGGVTLSSSSAKQAASKTDCPAQASLWEPRKLNYPSSSHLFFSRHAKPKADFISAMLSVSLRGKIPSSSCPERLSEG
jgi:hypothetical protein